MLFRSTTITVGTASTAWGLTSQGDILAYTAMDATTALVSNYGNGATAQYYVRTIIHNGTSAPTIGTPTALTGTFSGNMTYNGMCKLTSTTAFYFYSEAYTAKVITISGSSAPTLGTTYTVSSNLNINWRYNIYALPYSSTEVILQNYYGAKYTVLSISGTTITSLVSPTAKIGRAHV